MNILEYKRVIITREIYLVLKSIYGDGEYL